MQELDGAEGALDGDGACWKTVRAGGVDWDVEVAGPAGAFEIDPFVFVWMGWLVGEMQGEGGGVGYF